MQVGMPRLSQHNPMAVAATVIVVASDTALAVLDMVRLEKLMIQPFDPFEP